MTRNTSISYFSIVVIAICLTVIGTALLPLLPLKLLPSEKMQSISVSYSMRNATSKILETEVTSRLEALFARVRGVEELSSTSQNGYGSIRMSFDKYTDINAARFEIATIIRQAWTDMPEGASFPSIYVNSSDDSEQRPFLVYTINSLTQASEIQRKAEEVFKTGFADISGVSNVNIYGAEQKEWQLTYDIDKLQHLGITEQNLSDAISKYRYSSTVGSYVIKTDVDETSLCLSDIYVELPDSSYITMERLVDMKYVEARPTNYFRINGLNTIYIALTATENANQIALKHECEERVTELKQNLPSGYEIHKTYDETEYIQDELDKVYHRSGLTVIILLLFIALTTLNWRSVFVVVSSLVCNLAVAVIFYYLLGVELQIISLAGITISLNLIIDNTIIMLDHWRREHNLRAILPIIAATLTTVCAMSIVFFLEGRLRLNLYDFSVVMIINLMISIFTALWLVPSLMQLCGEKKVRKRFSTRRKRVVCRMTRCYERVVDFVCRRKVWFYILGIWGFGIPLFILPAKIDSDSFGAMMYNNTLGSKVYQNNIRPVTDVVFGGALRLFVVKVYNGSYWSNPEELVLHVAATLPYGSTIEQMDVLTRRMESYLTNFQEIKQFQTDIYSGQQAHITIYFTNKAQRSSFPYMLKSNIITKALQLGGGSWSVYGLPDNGFNNDVRQSTGSYTMEILGYNYETLSMWADSIKAHLLSNMRIKDVYISSSPTYYKSDYVEYHLSPNLEYMTHQNISTIQLFYALNHIFVNDVQCGVVWNASAPEAIKLCTRQSQEYDIWSLLNTPIEFNGRQYKISQLCTFEKTQAPQSIEKINQQYKLALQYEYIGSSLVGERISLAADSIYNARMPIGYQLKYSQRQWVVDVDEAQQYWFLGLIIGMIFFITAILFNSLRLPFIIIAIIPISYIGLFLTFTLFHVNFDQGGFAALVLLCGITVNASIYIVNESIAQMSRRRQTNIKAYLRAFRVKIVPIILTVVSTILGFIPFIIGEKEGIWFPLAAGTIGGLIFSLIGIFFFLPVFFVKKEVRRGRN
ncbi:MAG: efflux RND transporter permease subunit [Marinilabiliaceae bacterium]|nr:efflux RND transporter permease subunit [Marinilabiliaceae bacterium]